MKNTVSTFLSMKEEGTKITMLTAYDTVTARLINQAGINAILVGDSVGNNALGYESTNQVTMDDMVHHCAAVARGNDSCLLVCDMPFLSYETSDRDAVLNAGRLVREGHAQAVKLEGGVEVASRIKAITDAGIPVCAHIGLTPQSANAFGGFKVQGKSEEGARKLIEDALAVQEAGAFAVVIECVPAKLASLVSSKLAIPTIGIGAGAGCDGQVLVYFDMLAMADFKPKFVKQFAQVGQMMVDAFKAYDEEVKAGTFPGEEHTFGIKDEIMEKLY
ncbi:MAG: 3-methyl-2-oxobutanoate hydroxymethyltransferase [Coriobacteriia bacterium]|nr:3-methyl-2-oxobutanoate hydroxymethyltransferase [Coriobacteriia bacterium]